MDSLLSPDKLAELERLAAQMRLNIVSHDGPE